MFESSVKQHGSGNAKGAEFTKLCVFPSSANFKKNVLIKRLNVLVNGNVFIMGYVTYSLGCHMVCCSIASLAVGYIYLSCSHLYSLAS